nr:MAG TPA: hypothetical protein [Caudoviricetes sp.]
MRERKIQNLTSCKIITDLFYNSLASSRNARRLSNLD